MNNKTVIEVKLSDVDINNMVQRAVANEITSADLRNRIYSYGAKKMSSIVDSYKSSGKLVEQIRDAVAKRLSDDIVKELKDEIINRIDMDKIVSDVTYNVSNEIGIRLLKKLSI